MGSAKRLLVRQWQNLVIPNLRLAFLVPLVPILWLWERRLSPTSNFVPLIFAVWATVEYGHHKRKVLVEEMNNKRKRNMHNTEPLTTLEPCEWLNKLLISLWPNYMEPKLSQKFAAMMMKKLKAKKPKFIENIELQEFSLGLAPPAVGLECTYWTTEENEQVLHTGFHWDTNEMSILLAFSIAGPIKKRVLVVINSLHIKGDLRVVPILDGHCLLYSFESPPQVRIGVFFGGDSEFSPALELPGISFLLEKAMLAILKKLMIEPQRSCFSFPAVNNLQRHVSGANISVTVASGRNLRISRSCSNALYRSFSSSMSRKEADAVKKDTNKFAEVRLENVTRKTSCRRGGSLISWDETFDLVLDGSTGSIYVNVFEESPGHLESFFGGCKIKIKYIEDGSTVFWAIGKNNSSLAARANHSEEHVEMTVPLEGNFSAEISVRLLVREWYFVDDYRSDASHGLLGSVSGFQAPTGRTLQVCVEEARNLVAKDTSGKSDPYILLQYGKSVRRTKTLPRDLNPNWKETFEFAEIRGEEYMKLKCYDADLVLDDTLGSARVNLEGLKDDECRDFWVPLESIDTGEVRLTIKAVKSQSIRDKSKDTAPKYGMLELVLVEARNLVAADLRGTSDPFVSVHYGKQKKRTKVISKTLNPQWNQTLEFPDDGKSLELHVKDHNALLPTTSIGHCVVTYEDLPPNKTLDKWIPLQGVKKGEVHIRLTRRYHSPCKKSSSKSANMNMSTLLLKTSSKISDILKEARQLAEDGDMEQLQVTVSELEAAESEQDKQISQINNEKEMLLAKISELEMVMEVT